MAEDEAALQEHLGQVAQAQFVAQPPQDNQEHNVCGNGEVVEGGAAPLVEAASAGRAAERAVTQTRLLVLFLGPRRPAVRTDHRDLLSSYIKRPDAFEDIRPRALTKACAAS